MDRMDLAHWIDEGLKKPGKTTVGLGKALGIDRTGVSRMRTGERKILAEELPIIEAYLGERAPAGLTPNRQVAQTVDLDALERALESVNEYLDRTGVELSAQEYARVVRQLYKLTADEQTKADVLQAVTAAVVDLEAIRRAR